MIRNSVIAKLTLVLALTFSSASTFAQSTRESDLLKVARDSAIVAGGGRYCKFDPDEVEEVIARSEARLSLYAKDDYEKVLARLEFKNVLDAFSVREPDGGCENFKAVFDQLLRNIR